MWCPLALSPVQKCLSMTRISHSRHEATGALLSVLALLRCHEKSRDDPQLASSSVRVPSVALRPPPVGRAPDAPVCNSPFSRSIQSPAAQQTTVLRTAVLEHRRQTKRDCAVRYARLTRRATRASWTYDAQRVALQQRAARLSAVKHLSSRVSSQAVSQTESRLTKEPPRKNERPHRESPRVTSHSPPMFTLRDRPNHSRPCARVLNTACSPQLRSRSPGQTCASSGPDLRTAHQDTEQPNLCALPPATSTRPAPSRTTQLTTHPATPPLAPRPSSRARPIDPPYAPGDPAKPPRP